MVLNRMENIKILTLPTIFSYSELSSTMKQLVFILIAILIVFSSYGQTAQGYFERGITKLNSNNDYLGAISDFNKAIELNPKLKNVYFARAQAKEKLEDYRGAISDYNKDIALTPNNPGSYYNRGIVKYFRLRDLDGGCLDWSKSGEQGYSDAYETVKKYCN
jgi:tetratricopeptide (TPR) repeat protein